MSATPEKKAGPGHTDDKPVFHAFGVLLQFLATPDGVKDGIGLIRGTIPPGVAVPLHSHRDPELFYILEGSLDVFQSNVPSSGWTTVGVGDVATIRSNVKHALRNRSGPPVSLMMVTKPELYEFFREVAKPFDPIQRPTPPTAEAMQRLFAVAAKYGYWLASTEDNEAIGLTTLKSSQ